jgi:uncharacterized protein YjiS (DUF1127 family)
MEQLAHITEVKTMTTALTLSQNVFSKFYNSVQSFFAEIAKRKAKARLVKKTVRQLNELTDRELRDIGLSRYDIEMVAKEYMDELNSK